MVKYIRGGIGDILISLGSITQGETYVVWSHYDRAADLVRPYTTNFTYTPMTTPIASVADEVSPTFYPTLKIPEEYIDEAKSTLDGSKIIVGIHPIGSKLSLSVDNKLGRPKKFIPIDFIKNLINDLSTEIKDLEFLLFCAPDEEYLFYSTGLRIISEIDIWKSLSYVYCCDVMLSVDSAIKTASAILHKPTVVALGDYPDQWRNKFIDPYEEITTIKFKDINLVYKEYLEESKKAIKKILVK